MINERDFYNQEKTLKYYEAVGSDLENKTGTDYNKYINKIIPKDLYGKIVLDIGCGNGMYAEEFCKKGAERVIAMDLSESMINEAKKRKEEKGLENLDLVQGDMDSLPIGKEKIDYIFSRFSLMHSSDISGVMNSLSRCLKKDGEMLITVNYFHTENEEAEKKYRQKLTKLKISINEMKVEVDDYLYLLEDYEKGFIEAGLEVSEQGVFVANDLSLSSLEIKDENIKFGYAVFKLKKRQS